MGSRIRQHPDWASACHIAAIKSPPICAHKLIKPPPHLHLTIVQTKLFLDALSWTGQADRNRIIGLGQTSWHILNSWHVQRTHQPSRKPSVQYGKQAMQTLPCMWIYGTEWKANYFPTSLNTYGHPRTQHNKSYAMSWKPAMASCGTRTWPMSERCHTLGGKGGKGLLPPMCAHSAP